MSVRQRDTHTSTRAGYAQTIQEVTLPDEVQSFVGEYEAIGGERDRFVWKWIYRLFPAFRLSSVAEADAQEVRTRKTLFTLFITLLDDLAERRGSAEEFEEIYRSVQWATAERGERPDAGSEVVAFADRLWDAIEQPLAEAPRYDEFRDVFQYDLRQALNAMDYSRILNDHLSMANLSGAKHYDSHNMVMFPYADMDLMYSPSFDPADLGVLRELVWDLQQMARIGNWLTTWEREVDEGDYSAGVVVYALQNGLIDRDELEGAGPEVKTAAMDRIKAHRVESMFLAEWERLHRKVAERDLEARSVDLGAFVDGMEVVMEHHLASKGHK